MKTLTLRILALSCLSTALAFAQTAPPAPAPSPAPPAVAMSAVMTPPAPSRPDYGRTAKELLGKKDYQNVLTLVEAMNAEITALSQSNDALYQRTLKLSMQISTMTENRLADESERLNQEKQNADNVRSVVIQAVEETSPGMRWDESQGKLVPRTMGAGAPAAAKSAPAITPAAAVKK